MYAAVTHTLHYCGKDWGTNVLPTCSPPQSELVLSPASILSYEDHYVHSPRTAFDDPQLRTVLLRRDFTLSTTTNWLRFDYSRNTVRFCGIILRDSADAFDNSDCADALLQIRRYPWMTIPRTPFDESVDIPNDAVDKLWIAHVVNPQTLQSSLCHVP